MTHLAWWSDLKSLSNLLFPGHLVLAVDFSSNTKVLTSLCQKTCAQNDCVWTSHGLVVINMRGAVWAVVAVRRISWKTEDVSLYFDCLSATYIDSSPESPW